MELYEELEPMMWAFVSGVDEDKIHANTMNKDERIRVERAIEILKDTQLYLEDEENYDISFLSHTIEHYKTEHNIGVVAVDYLELTSALTSEFTQMTRGMGVREDQVLLNLSANIKNMAKRYDLAIIGFTQTTDEARRDGVRDQRAVKGARSLPNKCDLGMVSFAPTKKELELLEEVIDKVGLNNFKCVPNICYSVYKNRGGKHKNIKIWGYQNLGTMEYIDLFCTDESYIPINVDRTFLMPNLVDEESEVGYTFNEDTGEIIDDSEEFEYIVEDEIEPTEYISEEPVYEEESSEDETEEMREYRRQVEAYNSAMMEQYAGDESHVLEYNEDGLLEAFPVQMEVAEVVEESIVEETVEAEVSYDDNDLEDPFADLPIIDDEELEFLNVALTGSLGRRRKGF